MPPHIVRLLPIFLLALALPLRGLAAVASQPAELTIVYSNDVQGETEPCG